MQPKTHRFARRCRLREGKVSKKSLMTVTTPFHTSSKLQCLEQIKRLISIYSRTWCKKSIPVESNCMPNKINCLDIQTKILVELIHLHSPEIHPLVRLGVIFPPILHIPEGQKWSLFNEAVTWSTEKIANPKGWRFFPGRATVSILLVSTELFVARCMVKVLKMTMTANVKTSLHIESNLFSASSKFKNVFHVERKGKGNSHKYKGGD